jgi:two-component system chemotaxis sensor kinase CheA
MDDGLLQDFLVETTESIEKIDQDLLSLEKDPNNPPLIDSIFRLMHTIKGTCGFLELKRLASLAHAAETLLGKMRDGEKPITQEPISLILEAMDQVKFIIAVLEEDKVEPEGDDNPLIASLDAMSRGEIGGPPEPEAHSVSAAAQPVEPALLESLEESSDSEPEAVVVSAAPAPSLKTVAKAPAPEKPKPEAKSEPKKPSAEDSAEEKGGAAVDQTIRIRVDLVESLMNLVGELVLTRNQLLQLMRQEQDNLSVFATPLQHLSHVTSELQDGIVQARMQPVGNAWKKLPRIIRDLSVELGKKMDLILVGEETELDRQVIEMIRDPLIHMVRNAADHGVETPAERLAAGKPETGQIHLQARHEGGYIVMTLKDDGRGLNIDAIKKKVLEKGLCSPEKLADMEDEKIQQFIFAPGFSTAATLTSVSGRGVGMDVVCTNIERIGGVIQMASQQGQGSTFTIKIPLTLAIISAMIVGIGGQRMAIPQLGVSELVRITPQSDHKIEFLKGAPVLRLRNKLLPLVDLRSLLHLESDKPEGGSTTIFIVVARVGASHFGMIVDRVFDTEDIVVKPLAPILQNLGVFSGNTILGDGQVIMILDTNGVAQTLGDTLTGQDSGPTTPAVKKTIASNLEEQVSLLVFRAGTKTMKAIPLAMIARLEEIDLKTLEYTTDKPVLQYRGSLIPIVTISGDYHLAEEGIAPMLVFNTKKQSVGMIVDEIIDIVQAPMHLTLPSEGTGILGTLIINNQATDIVDAYHHMHKVVNTWQDSMPMSTKGGFSSAASKRSQRILFVDDSAFFRNLLTPMLETAGYAVLGFEAAADALRALKSDPDTVDLILSDIEMPEMNGFAFAKAVTEDPTLQNIPLIAFTAHVNSDMTIKARKSGFRECVAKFDREGLLSHIAHFLGHHSVAA